MSTKVLSNQRVTVLAGLASGISVWANPSLAELTALTNVSGAVNWNSFDLNVKPSDHKDDRTLTDGAGAQSRSGYINFGGGLELVYPAPADTSSIYRTAYNLFSTMRVELVVAVRYGPLNSTAAAAGDEWNIYHVTTDAVSFGQGDVSKFYKVNLLPKDDVVTNYIVPPGTAVAITTSALSTTGTTGKVLLVSALYQGWDITNDATWTTSDGTKLQVVHPGIFLIVAAGSPTIQASYPGATPSTALATTLS